MRGLPGGQLVFLLARAWPCSQWQLAHRSQVADHLVQFTKLCANLQQLSWIGSQVFHVCASRLLQHVFSFVTITKTKELDINRILNVSVLENMNKQELCTWYFKLTSQLQVYLCFFKLLDLVLNRDFPHTNSW